jgi:hypothetical protein
MLRTFLFTGATVCGLGALLTAPPTAQAHPPAIYPAPVVVTTYYPPPPPVVVTTYSPVVVQPVARFEVVYRTRAWQPYRVYGTYASERYAHEAARHLHHGGYAVRVDVIR